MNSKDKILSKLREKVTYNYDMPDIKIKGIQYEDKLQQFIAISKAVGGNALIVKKDEDLNVIVRSLYPNAQTFASNLPEISISTKNPDTVEKAQDLDGTDVSIVRGEIGVAENGCIWIPQTMKEKAVCFIPEYLVILIDESKIVNNMHEAYERISFNDYGFGSFISGPSKTADIEQALVMGAQSARGVSVLIIE